MCTDCALSAAGAAMVKMAGRLGVTQAVGIVLLKETVLEEGMAVPGPRVVFIGDPILTVGGETENTVNLLSEGVRVLAEMIETGEASTSGALRNFGDVTAYAVFVGATTDENDSVADVALNIFEAVVEMVAIQDYLTEVFEDDTTDDRTFDE